MPPAGGFGAFSKEWLKTQAQNLASKATSWVGRASSPIKSISAPIRTLSNTATKAVEVSAGGIASGFKIGVAVLVVIVAFVAFAYVRAVMPRK